MGLKDAITWIRNTCDGDIRLRAEFRLTGETLLSAVYVESAYDDIEARAKAAVTQRLRNMLYGEILEELRDIHLTLKREDRELSIRPATWPMHPTTEQKISDLRSKILHILS